MKKLIVISEIALACCASFALLGCTADPQTAGVSTVETENALVIQVTDGSAPAKGVLARVRSARYLQNVDNKPYAESDGVAAEYTADSKGFVYITKKEISSLKLAEISVEVVGEKQGAFGIFALDGSEETAPDSATLALEKFGSLKGHVTFAEGDTTAEVRIYGTDRIVSTDSEGNFEINDLPPYAHYTLMVGSSYNTVVEMEAGVSAEKTKDVGEIVLKKYVLYDDMFMISDWMKVAKSARQEGEPVVGFIRLNSRNFDFSEVMAQGKDVQVETEDGDPMTYAINYWNDTLEQAEIQVLLDAKTELVKLTWGMGAVDEKSAKKVTSSKLWESVSAEVAREQNSVSLIDFENGFKSNVTAPAAVFDWYFEYQGDSVETTPGLDNAIEGVESAGAGRDGKAFHWKSKSPNGSWSYVGLWLSSAKKPSNFQAIDSVEFMVRGTGRIAFAFEAEDTTGYVSKAFNFDSLATDSGKWVRKVIKQSDFAEGTGAYANIGWDVIQTRVTNFNIAAYGEAEFWLDDIKFYGVNLDDL